MKKVMIALMLVVAAHTASFANNNDLVKNTVKEVATRVKDAPSGTTYGVVETTKDYIVVATPLGRYTIDKNPDGSFSFMPCLDTSPTQPLAVLRERACERYW